MAKKNQAFWDASSDAYQAKHSRFLGARPAAWGTWRIAEAELRVLGDVEGRSVLELGCGAAQWTVALIAGGAKAVGFDLSARQLGHARRAPAAPPLVQGDAELLPFRDASFDVVFCDHGALTFAHPHRAVPEAARVLRPGGTLAFCMSTPIHDLGWDPASSETSGKVYFDLEALDDDGAVNYQLPYGEWIRLFRRHRLIVEDLVELRPPEGATTTYEDYVSLDWARRLPAEHIWKLAKEG